MSKESSVEVEPLIGLGSVRFGDKADSVIEKYGPGSAWNADWMWGNMNDCLMYGDTVFQFDGSDANIPLPESSLISIQLQRRQDSIVFGVPFVELSREMAEDFLAMQNQDYKVVEKTALQIDSWRMELTFDSHRMLEHVLFEAIDSPLWW